MSYITRNQELQNFFGVFTGVILAIIWGFIYIPIYSFNYGIGYLSDILFPIFYFLFMIVTGITIGLISYRKNGIIIGMIIGIIASFSYMIYLAVLFYGDSSIGISTVLLMFENSIGGCILFLASILGCYIKYKAQRGANYTMPSLKKIAKSISSIGEG
ncbi:MAG: hypothetical protein ACFFDW_09530 [Candidatus Thorarchaeota archaeon]